MNQQFSTRKPRTLPTLTQLSIAKLRRHISQITDVGNAPFHLLEPILQQMQSKQLNELENSCNQLLPYSDKLWMKLIARDFPDRPIKLDPLRSSSSSSSLSTTSNSISMPYKSLYYKYCKDRENFRKDSAKKLRYANRSIEKEKSKTRIIAVDQVLRDPSIRKTNYTSSNGYTRSMQPVNKNSILQKAKRDTVQSRNLIFARNQHVRAYDPFHAFKVHGKNSYNDLIRPPGVHNNTARRRTTFFNATSESLKSPPITKPPLASRIPRIEEEPTKKVEVGQPPSSPVKPTLDSQKSSIFLQRKRRSPPHTSLSASTTTMKRTKKPTQPQEPRSKIKQLKSSIFS